jgi:uncharacterized membrane protein
MSKKLRLTLARCSLGLAIVLILWLAFGLLNLVPLTLQLPGESKLRTLAGAAVALLMLAAWGYWEN